MRIDDPSRDGFTLVELVMVLVLVGIMAGIVTPVLRPEGFRMNSALVQVGTTLTGQQRNAVLRQHDVVVAFDTVRRRLRIHEDVDNDGVLDDGERWHVVELPEGVRFGRGGTPARPLGDEDISLTQTRDDLPSLTFHRNGSASEQGIIYLTSERSGSDLFPEDGRAVEVERATGRVRCFSYRVGGWRERC